MKKNTILGVITALLGIGCGIWLLIYMNKISGMEFVALSLGFAVIGLTITFSTEVQEFSVAGNGVKLKELRTEAERTIEELKQARNELFRILVQKSIDQSGGFGGISKVESRAKSFVHLFGEIEKINCVNELKSDLEKSLKIIMLSQYNNLTFIHQTRKKLEDKFTDADKPQFLYIKLNDELIRESYQGRSPDPVFQTEKEDIIEAIDMYGQLYKIKVKLDSL